MSEFFPYVHVNEVERRLEVKSRISEHFMPLVATVLGSSAVTIALNAYANNEQINMARSRNWSEYNDHHDKYEWFHNIAIVSGILGTIAAAIIIVTLVNERRVRHGYSQRELAEMVQNEPHEINRRLPFKVGFKILMNESKLRRRKAKIQEETERHWSDEIVDAKLLGKKDVVLTRPQVENIKGDLDGDDDVTLKESEEQILQDDPTIGTGHSLPLMSEIFSSGNDHLPSVREDLYETHDRYEDDEIDRRREEDERNNNISTRTNETPINKEERVIVEPRQNRTVNNNDSSIPVVMDVEEVQQYDDVNPMATVIHHENTHHHNNTTIDEVSHTSHHHDSTMMDHTHHDSVASSSSYDSGSVSDHGSSSSYDSGSSYSDSGSSSDSSSSSSD